MLRDTECFGLPTREVEKFQRALAKGVPATGDLAPRRLIGTRRSERRLEVRRRLQLVTLACQRTQLSQPLPVATVDLFPNVLDVTHHKLPHQVRREYPPHPRRYIGKTVTIFWLSSLRTTAKRATRSSSPRALAVRRLTRCKRQLSPIAASVSASSRMVLSRA